MQATDRFHPFLLPAALVVWGLTAWFSSGFHHHDEHFQVLEFAQMKMGHTQASDLPWEFREQMRPGLQPWLTVAIVRASAWVGLNNPFDQAFLMRLLAGWCTLLALLGWGRATMIRAGARTGLAFTGLALFLWCMPYLGVRFSSEGLATAAFLWSALFLYEQDKPDIAHWFLAGLLAGLSFSFRYQMGITLAGMVVWCLFFRPRQWWDMLLGYQASCWHWD